MSETVAHDGEAQQGFRRYRKTLGGGMLFLAWACITLVKPEFDDRGTVAPSPVVQNPQAFDAVALERVHLWILECEEPPLQEVVPDPSLAPKANSLLARDPGNRLEPRRRSLGVAVQGVSVAGGKEAPLQRFESVRADATCRQTELDAQTMAARRNRDISGYRTLCWITEAVGQLVFIVGILLML